MKRNDPKVPYSTSPDVSKSRQVQNLRSIGSGSYGEVYYDSDKREVIKVFRPISLATLIREVSLGLYLKPYPYFVKVKSFNLRRLQLVMEPWACDLRAVICEGRGTHEERLKIFTDVVCALNVMHYLDLVHADVKPSNILVREVNGVIEGGLSDFSLTSLSPYASVEDTTKLYSEKVCVRSSPHDVYSLGIVSLELFGQVKFLRQPDYQSVLKMTKRIRDPTIHSLTSRMLTADHQARITTQEILEVLSVTCILDPVGIDRLIPQQVDRNLYDKLTQLSPPSGLNLTHLARCIQLHADSYGTRPEVLTSWLALASALYYGRYNQSSHLDCSTLSRLICRDCITSLLRP